MARQKDNPSGDKVGCCLAGHLADFTRQGLGSPCCALQIQGLETACRLTWAHPQVGCVTTDRPSLDPLSSQAGVCSLRTLRLGPSLRQSLEGRSRNAPGPRHQPHHLKTRQCDCTPWASILAEMPNVFTRGSHQTGSNPWVCSQGHARLAQGLLSDPAARPASPVRL